VADGGDLHAGAVFHLGQDGHDGVDGEMDLIDRFARPLQTLFLLDGSAPKVPVEALIVLFGQAVQKPVGEPAVGDHVPPPDRCPGSRGRRSADASRKGAPPKFDSGGWLLNRTNGTTIAMPDTPRDGLIPSSQRYKTREGSAEEHKDR